MKFKKCWGRADLVADAQWNLWDLYVDEGVVHGSSLFHLVNIIHRVLGKEGKKSVPHHKKLRTPNISISFHPWNRLKGNGKKSPARPNSVPQDSPIFLSSGACLIPQVLCEMTF